jgi:hypothetical protein
MCSSRQGFLLVEAALSAVVIAVGLVLVSQALSSPLQALRTIGEREAMLSLANEQLLELEVRAAAGEPMPVDAQGSFEERGGGEWRLRIRPMAASVDADGTAEITEATLTVQRPGTHAPTVSLSGLWPSAWGALE